MKIFVCLVALLAPALAVSGAASGIDTLVSGIPAGASEVVVVIEPAAAPPAPDYQDPAQQAAPPKADNTVQQKQEDVIKQLQPPAAADPQAPAPAAQPQAQAAADAQNGAAGRPGQRQALRGRRGRGGIGAATVTVEPIRDSVKTKGATSVTVHSTVPVGANYRVRVVAIKGDDPFPTVVAGGKTIGVKVEADKIASTSVSLLSPVLKLADDHPATVAANAHFKLAGTITDPSSFLGTKTRMRVWLSAGRPPAANYDGTQVSTVDVTIKDDIVSFNFDLTAPKDPTTLYFQLGEVSPDFARKDGSQAAFLVLPDLSIGANPLQLRVEEPKASVASKD
jgi:hypothetical protein